MTIGEALARTDELVPNSFSRQQKLAWLSQAEGSLWCELLAPAGGGEAPFYGETAGDETVLLVPAPWDGLYIHWLESCIDYAAGETARFNNANALYTALRRAYGSCLTRSRLPRESRIRWW